MIIQKRVQKEIKLETKKIDLEKEVENEKPFEGLIYKIRDDEERSYFVRLDNKLEAPNEDDEQTESENEDIKTTSKSRLNDHLKMGSTPLPLPDKELSFGHEEDIEKKYVLTGRIIVESEGILYDLTDYEKIIDDKAFIATLSIKDCFTINELLDKEFRMVELKYDEANKKFEKDILSAILHNEQIEVSIEDIFNNRDKFQVTKINLTGSKEIILELNHYKEIKYNKKTTLMDALNTFTEEKEISLFSDNFNLNTP